MFPCSLIGKLTAGSVLLLRMALTAAMGKYNKQGYLSIASANANLSNKKVWLQRISRAHPGFFPPTLLSSSNHLPLCLLWFIPACKGQGESLLRLKEGLELPRKHQPAQCQLLSIPLGCVHPQQWGTVLALQAYIYISNRLSNKLPCTCMVHLRLEGLILFTGVSTLWKADSCLKGCWISDITQPFRWEHGAQSSGTYGSVQIPPFQLPHRTGILANCRCEWDTNENFNMIPSHGF